MDIYTDPVHQGFIRDYGELLMTTLVLRSVVDAYIEFGKGLSWSHGEDHRRYIRNLMRSGSKRSTDFTRQRKSLTPGFSIAAIRQLTSIFYDSAYKVRLPSYGSWYLSDMDGNSL